MKTQETIGNMSLQTRIKKGQTNLSVINDLGTYQRIFKNIKIIPRKTTPLE